MVGEAKTAGRVKIVEVVKAVPCPKCGQETRFVKRIKNRESGFPGGMFLACSVCDFAKKR